MTDHPKPSRFPELFDSFDTEDRAAWALYHHIVDFELLAANAQRRRYIPETEENGIRYVDLSHEEPRASSKSNMRETKEPSRYMIECPGKWRITLDFEWDEEEPLIKTVWGDASEIRAYLDTVVR